MASRTRDVRRWFQFVVVGLMVFWAGGASASPIYGYYLIAEFDFSPGCSGCHSSPTGGEGTVTRPFGLTMMSLGLMGNNNYELLIETLRRLGPEDSDGDGAPDAEEVLNGGDPNDPAKLPDGFVPGEPEPADTADTADTGMMPTTVPSTGSPGTAPMSEPSADGCSVSRGKLAAAAACGSQQTWSWVITLVMGVGILSGRRRRRRSG